MTSDHRQLPLATMDRIGGSLCGGKAMSILAARLGRAIYTMLKRGEVFDENRFFAGV